MQEINERITGNDFRHMIVGAYNTFMREHERINSLNVFPVPDGDTGANMLMTLGAVARSVSEAADQGIGALSKKAADSAIMGARGNSGVILSQLFRGIARGLAGKEEAGSSAVGKAFQYGILYAYRAVARPVEGTILTVAKGIAKGARHAVREGMSFADILSEAISAGRAELAHTPDLLPVLKSAGVVDAGGYGLIVFLEGCLEGLGGSYAGPEAGFDQALTTWEHEEHLDVVHPYCTEFLIKHCTTEIEEIRRELAPRGDSLVLGEGDGVVKVHVHTAHPGQVLEMAIAWGSLHDIKIDNMADQHRSFHAAAPKNAVAVISVAAGEGIADIMRQAGADILIPGGETMNPPVEDFVKAVHAGSAQRYILLPNNKNITLAANQAKKLLGDRVEVVPSLNIPQGLAALISFEASRSFAENIQQMKQAMQEVRSGSLTIAVRDSKVAGRIVPQGRYIGVVDGAVVNDAADISDALVALARLLMQEGGEVITLYYGADLTPEQANAAVQPLREALAGIEVEMYYGGQPYYHFLMSVE